MVMVFPSIWWGWSPEVRYVPFPDDPLQNLKQMMIPAVILGTALSAITMRLTRTHDARGAAAGLHPHRLGQGPERAHRGRRATRCATR